MTINNPIIPGMAPDPSIIRVDDTYYIATSTFHWNPSIQLYKSKDLANWELVGYALSSGDLDLRGTATPAGVWAPNLSYDFETKKFWLVYSHMLNMAGREFNADTYAISASSITGPWTTPIYLTSIGFDPSIFHDNDGRKYISILEWETRTNYQAPGHIVIAEIDLASGEIGEWHRVSQGFTSRGCAEAPIIYKHNDYYFLILAAGGTGYAHGVEIGRSKNIFGPYEPHPSKEPIVTSAPQHLFSLGNPDAGHFEMYNPNSKMQKAGHGSLVETTNGEWYLAHLMSRPLKGKLLNPLGRETAIQKMNWTEDNWLEMLDRTNLAKMQVPSISNQITDKSDTSSLNFDFKDSSTPIEFMTPYRQQNRKWVNTIENPNHLRIYGQNSLFSQMNPAIMATRATTFTYEFCTKLYFTPTHYSQTAGAGLYYDSNNWLYAHLTYSESVQTTVLTILQSKLGTRIEFPNNIVKVAKNCVELKLNYHYGELSIQYKLNNNWHTLLSKIDVSYLSDEGVNGMPGEIGGFTGLFNFIGAVDALQHKSYADFSYYRITEIK